MLSEIKLPDSKIVREAEEFVRSVSNDMLYNHLMRCAYFGELLAQQEDSKADRELMFLSATLHDLGFTDAGRGPNRFEVEGAHAARKFLLDHGVEDDRTWRVWGNIASHTIDINLFKEDESRLSQLGILFDVIALPPEIRIAEEDKNEIVRRYPRLNFKEGFYQMHAEDLDTKQPYPHRFHFCTCIEHERGNALPIPDPRKWLNDAPFDE